MALLPEGTRFGLLRHMISSSLHLAVMAAVMVALMAAAMMMPLIGRLSRAVRTPVAPT